MKIKPKFDFLKFKIKDLTIQLSKAKAKVNRETVSKLEKEVLRIENELLAKHSEDLKSDLINAQLALESHYNRINQGLVVQSRVQYYEEGDKSTKFFLNQVRRNSEKTTIRQLKVKSNKNGSEIENVITDPGEILNHIHDFYQSLFTSKNSQFEGKAEEWIQDLKSRNLIPQLTKEKVEFLEKDITIEMIEAALKTCGSNKTPGSDGLSYEFFKEFWPDLSDLYMEYIEDINKTGELSTSQKQSVIKLIPKKDKDITYLKKTGVR